jgi:hypothetical protein
MPQCKLIILGLLCCLGCNMQIEIENPWVDYSNIRELEKDGEKKFQLDSLARPSSNSIQYFQDTHGREYFSFLNDLNNSIYFYDYSTTDFLFKIDFQLEGPNGVGNLMGHHIESLDTIVVYNYAMEKLFFSNKRGEIYKTIALTREANDKRKYLPSPKLWTDIPLIWRDSVICMIGNISGEFLDETEENRPIGVFIDIHSGKTKYAIPYSKPYKGANWGGQLFRRVYHTFNEDENKLVISFPADHHLTVYSFNDSIYQVHAGSNQIKTIKSYPSKRYLFNDKEKILKHFLENGSYAGVFYDKYRKLYYRIFLIPVEEYNPAHAESRTKQVGVVVYDENFQLLGQKVFEKFSHSAQALFVSPEGIFIQTFTDEEDLFVFNKYGY